MNNIIRFWNQNRKGIIAGIAAIVLLIVIIQILNQMAKKQREEKNNTQIIEEQEELPTKSIIGADTVSKEVTKSNVEMIESFIEKCNNGDIVGAYQMLTDDCKEILFSTEENFKKGYYNIIFKNKKISNIENFLSKDKRYTYKVSFYDDILSTGNAQNSETYQDYITIDENSKNGKLNINSFIYKKDINKETEKNGIKITIISQQIYKENEKYEIKIENNTNKRILIDTREKSKSVYLVGSNNVTYNSYIDELSSVLYEIPANFSRTYKIRFNKIYSSGIQTTKVVFSDIVPDYEKYSQTPDEMKERVQISVNI